ncbi:MAG: hypothetical protein DYG89_09340 [Caldilinea sp. CFX5]|nr:hypothetical protein [Caldilinea sp. CFX5]
MIDLPPMLENKVKAEAQKRKRTPEQVVIDRLAQTFEDDGVPTVAEVVARIKATPPNPAMITPPQGDLAAALRNGPTDPDFDLNRWEQEWAAAEAELKRINLLN